MRLLRVTFLRSSLVLRGYYGTNRNSVRLQRPCAVPIARHYFEFAPKERVATMSIVEWDPLSSHEAEPAPTPPRAASRDGKRPLHRLGEVRRQQGVSPRNMARRLNCDLATVRELEDESTDLPLSMIYRWQQILEVPLEELLVDSNAPLSPPVLERARMVKVMKTVAAISEKADTPALKRLLQMLCEQLLEIMPELTDVAPWHTVGQRRTLDEYGRAVERQMPDDMFRKSRR